MALLAWMPVITQGKLRLQQLMEAKPDTQQVLQAHLAKMHMAPMACTVKALQLRHRYSPNIRCHAQTLALSVACCTHRAQYI